MREILFRGKRIDKDEWAEGSLLHDTEQNESYIAECFEDKAAYIRQVIPETVGQYTGMTDKNGKMIFEGDIVRYYQGYDYYSVMMVAWWKNGARFVIAFSDKLYSATSLISAHFYCEVIGNIHDNPELIGGATNESD